MNKKSVGIITAPLAKSGLIPLSNLMDIVSPISNQIFLISGDEAYKEYENNIKIIAINVRHKSSKWFFIRIARYILLQLKISFQILLLRNRIDYYIFFIGGDTMLIPALVSRITKKRVFLFIAGSSINTLESVNDFLRFPLKVVHSITCTLVDKIIVYGNGVINEYSLDKWMNKIVIGHEHFIDFNKFKLKNEYHTRNLIVGFVGRFNAEKGILQLIRAIPDVILENSGLEFLIIGDGDLSNTIRDYVFSKNLESKVTMPGWIPHDSLPDFLNQMKLLVIPSDTEGLPNIMLEAMACGTPVLASPVGVIPDLIRNEVNGFILKNNSDVCISKNILKIISHPLLDGISINAIQAIRDNYSFEKTKLGFEKIINSTDN